MPNDDQHQFKDRYMLRLPDGMRDRIKSAAEANNRSMNAEIVATLDSVYPEPVRSRVQVLLEISHQMEALADRRKAATTEDEKSALLDQFIELSDKLSKMREKE